MLAQTAPARLYPLRPHAVQERYYASLCRFNVVPAGRRSGKTEIFKRKLVTRAMRARGPDPRFFAGAPTRDQAKRIFWKDLKAMVHPALVKGKPQESDLIIQLVNAAEIHVVGMDVPQRIEGVAWDGGGLDEYGNMKPQAFDENVFPALADRNGWCDLIGVPEGRNHYYDKWKYAISGVDPEWAGFTWFSADILPPEAVATMRRSMDLLTFQQECEGSFVNFEGRAYYVFTEECHANKPLAYNPEAPLALCFDFNVDPGVAAIVQEQHLPNGMPEELTGTGVIGEVHIPQNSNTPAVCRRIAQDWGEHKGWVICYGDATGGARGSAQKDGSDWDIVQAELRGVFSDKLIMRVPKANMTERSRINAVNSRLRTAEGGEWMMVDPAKAPNCVKDFEGVRLLKGGSGEIDKKADLRLTHLSDAIGYYIAAEFPVVPSAQAVQRDMY